MSEAPADREAALAAGPVRGGRRRGPGHHRPAAPLGRGLPRDAGRSTPPPMVPTRARWCCSATAAGGEPPPAMAVEARLLRAAAMAGVVVPSVVVAQGDPAPRRSTWAALGWSPSGSRARRSPGASCGPPSWRRPERAWRRSAAPPWPPSTASRWPRPKGSTRATRSRRTAASSTSWASPTRCSRWPCGGWRPTGRRQRSRRWCTVTSATGTSWSAPTACGRCSTGS